VEEIVIDFFDRMTFSSLILPPREQALLLHFLNPRQSVQSVSHPDRKHCTSGKLRPSIWTIQN